MAIYKSDIADINLESGNIHRSFLSHTIGSGDNSANRFGIRAFRDGVPEDLSGCSCQAVFMNAAGTNIALTSYGTVSGNEAYVTLPQACYNVEGQFCLAIKLIKSGVTVTSRIVDGVVYNTGTTGAVAPTSSVPTYQEILDVYAAMQSATSAANLAIAEEFDASESYPAGKNVINDGALYVLPNGHTAGTTWANTNKTASNLGDQVTDLKSALANIYRQILVTKEDGGEAYQYRTFPIVNGHRYTVVNKSSATVNLASFTAGDSSGSVVENIVTSVSPNTEKMGGATANASYIRVYFYQGYGTVEIIDESYGVMTPINKFNDKVDKDGIGQINEQNTTFFHKSPNLIDLTEVVDGYRLNQQGTDVYADEGRSTTGYINVSALTGVQYFYFPSGVKTATTYYYVCYNASKTPLANRASTSNAVDVTSAAYIRISFTTEQKGTASLVSSSASYPTYMKYGYTFDYASDAVIEVKPTDDVIAILLANGGKKILFTDGTYDVISIYKAKLGNDYFDNYVDYSSGGNNLGRGLPILRGTKVMASEGAKFTAEYTGANTAVRSNFSMFAIESDVTLEGINASASGIRNIIHDDFDNNYSGNTYIKGCKLTCDNKVIAGGLALHDYVEISDCYIDNTLVGATMDFSYHNNSQANAQSKIVIKDNYLAHGVSLRYYGASTVKSLALVSNNSMVNDVEYIPENSSAVNDNIDVKKWNNFLRT